ncbi:ATP-binding protein [Desulfosporosinus sp. Sb-LF]|uniref:ATP-binding protein n=1 Tax=Desulfosporosinus sp. Sb-LF TaxID=2560027 RepID=UPI001A7E9297|nr:ATP-binding protein [Desulfosporosinus sp. Sb-LF]
MLRRGYIARNPIKQKDFNQRIHSISEQDEKLIESVTFQGFKDIKSSALTLSIIGISGIGKTTAIEKLLKMYPQVIRHTKKYEGMALNRTQIVWLKLDCPFDGSLKTFCQIFFKAVDDVLETNYYDKFGDARNSRGKMMIDMERLATIHSVGVIAIDEMQHLISKKTDPDELLNFLVTLENKIGVPIILIGTFKALKVLTKELRQSRRAASQKSIYWDRMAPDEEWDLFLKTMWKFQWLKIHTPLSNELAELMYEQSQGITAIAVSLFLLAQERALFTDDERITEKIILNTANEDLYMVSDIIRALRDNDRARLAQLEDVAIDMEKIINSKREKLDLNGKIASITQSLEKLDTIEHKSKVQTLMFDLTGLGFLSNLNQRDFEGIATRIVNELGVNEDYLKIKQLAIKTAMEENDAKAAKASTGGKKIKKAVESKGLIHIFHQAIGKKKHVYELLNESGYIKNVEEFA